MALLINKKLAAFEADTAEYLHQELEELGVVYGSGKYKMSKVTWATVIVLTAGPTDLTIL